METHRGTTGEPKYSDRFQNCLLYLRSDPGTVNRFIQRYVALSASTVKGLACVFRNLRCDDWLGYPSILISRGSFVGSAPSRRKVALVDWITAFRVLECVSVHSIARPEHRASEHHQLQLSVGYSASECRHFGCWMLSVPNCMEIGSSKGWRLGL